MRYLLQGAVIDSSGSLLALMTVLFFLFFAAVAYRAYSPRSKDAHAAAAQLPLLDDDQEAP